MVFLFKALRKLFYKLSGGLYTPLAKLNLFLNGANVGSGLDVRGFIWVMVTSRGSMKIGSNLRLNSGPSFNVIGRQQKCIFWVEGDLTIGSNVGMSATAIICNHSIAIGDNVIIGGNTVIYDTDFHSLDPKQRCDKQLDRNNAQWGPVVIEDNVFIGAHSTILKGVRIGQNSIIGGCSVVTKNIQPNEVWAGNPAVFIKRLTP